MWPVVTFTNNQGTMVEFPKATSYEYGLAYQLEQAEKHRHRHENHWKPRIALAHTLIDRHVLPRLDGVAASDIKTLDVGCSIGTMAIEMALRGFTACGVDFDSSALDIARTLAHEERVNVQFFQCDVADLGTFSDTLFDIAICFDIFEHLHDDELGAFLQFVRRRLSSRGALVFYTFPLQFDYLFFSRDLLHWPLALVKWLPSRWFERVVRAYAAIIDACLLIGTGRSYKERIAGLPHCNPTTMARLRGILERAGFSIEFIETENIYPFKRYVADRFLKQPIAHRNLYGVARPAAIQSSGTL